MYLGQMLLQKTSDPGKRSRGSRSNRNRIDATFHLFKNFTGGSLVMEVRIGRVFKLSGHESGGIASRQIFGTLDCTLHALGLRSPDHFGAEASHDDYFFF